MAAKTPKTQGHTGRTGKGNTRDVKIERVGKVTIYQRGKTYFLYYRDGGISQRRKIDGNLAVARNTAHKIITSLAEGKPSPIAYNRTSPEKLVDGFLDATANVQSLSLRTQDRYRAAMQRFKDFATDAKIRVIDSVQEATVEDFVKWLRGQKRTRNGATKGKKEAYKTGGIKFILSTCRTAFNWAARHRMLPPFSENPFIRFPIDKLRDPSQPTERKEIFTPVQEQKFFATCSTWQHSLFSILASYGLRVGELTHLLIDDLDFQKDVLEVRSKPWLFWNVKTRRERSLPLTAATKAILQSLIGNRKTGFVFLNERFAGKAKLAHAFQNSRAFQAQAEKVVADLLIANPEATQRDQKKAVVAFCRSMGQIPEKRVRDEFMAVTTEIGCPEFTRVHDLRHVFSSRAQEAGMNPILVQEMLGHATLDMTRRYTHLGMDTKREALKKLALPGAAAPPEAAQDT